MLNDFEIRRSDRETYTRMLLAKETGDYERLIADYKRKMHPDDVAAVENSLVEEEIGRAHV